MNDLVSIIVPVYNAEQYIEKCLDSLLKQTFCALEILVINDGSTDKSEELILKYTIQDHRIRYVAQENCGISATREKGVQLISGEYFCFVDSDDFVDENYVKKLYQALVENDADLVWCDYNHQVGDKITRVKQDKETVFHFEFPCLWNKMFKKSLFLDNDIHFPDGLWYEDLATVPRLLLSAKKTVYVQEALYTYYQHSNSITTTFSFKASDMNQVIAILEDFWDSHDFSRDDSYKSYIFAYILCFHVFCGTMFRMMMSETFTNQEISEYYEGIRKKLGIYRYHSRIFSRLSVKYKLFYLLVHKWSIPLVRLGIHIIKK